MALMPEDLLNKRFTPVRFSEGYDMDEVDNYLDNDVLPRLEELIAENTRLTTELEEAHNRIAELETAGASAAAPSADGTAAADDVVADDEVVAADEVAPAEAEPTAGPAVAGEAPVAGAAPAAGEPAAAQAPAEEAAPAAGAAPAARETPDQSAAGIIALANRLHDEYVQHGEDERDRLITEANDEHRRIVTEAEEKSRTTLEALATKKGELETTIEGLRTFERDYRNRLRDYLENQLQELDTSETQDKQTNVGL